jgi:hypothetical protein
MVHIFNLMDVYIYFIIRNLESSIPGDLGNEGMGLVSIRSGVKIAPG